MGFAATGTLACVTNYGSATVSIIRLPDNTVVATVPVGSAPGDCAFTPDGAFVYVTNSVENTVSVIRTSDYTEVTPRIPVGSTPLQIAIGPPPPVPVATLSLNASSFQAGDPLQLDLRLLTSSVSPRGGLYAFEGKWWLETPTDQLSLLNPSWPGVSLSLPPSFDQTFRILDVTVPDVLQKGNYRLGVRLLDLVNGRTLGTSTASFEVKGTAGNGLQMRLFDTPDPIAAVQSGFVGLTPGEFMVTTAHGTFSVTSFVVPVVNFALTGFEGEAFFNVGPNGVIDAGSTALTPVGDDISVQPPGGNDTFGASFAGFLFLPTGGDVTFTVGVDDVFDLIVDRQSVLRNLELTPFREFSARVKLPSGFIPVTLNFGESGGGALIVLSAAGGGLPGGVIPQEFLFTEIPR